MSTPDFVLPVRREELPKAFAGKLGDLDRVATATNAAEAALKQCQAELAAAILSDRTALADSIATGKGTPPAKREPAATAALADAKANAEAHREALARVRREVKSVAITHRAEVIANLAAARAVAEERVRASLVALDHDLTELSSVLAEVMWADSDFTRRKAPRLEVEGRAAVATITTMLTPPPPEPEAPVLVRVWHEED